MKLKNHKHVIFFGAAFVATFLFYLWFVHSPHFAVFKIWSESNLILYISVLFFIKVIGIIWPPIPGGIFTLASVPILGWELAYLTDFAGSLIGSTAAFFIARKWGWDFILKIFDTDVIEKFKKIKIKKHKEIESIFLMRFFGGTIIEAVCYGAGMLGVSYKNFLIATVLSHPILGIPIFYFAKNILGGDGVILSIIFLIVLVIAFYKLKHRYFDFE